jgi:DNA-binding response OmpR family regulator
MNGRVILLVEDNEDVLSAMERMLIRAGAAVLSARGAADARDQLRRLGNGRLDAVIIDFILPDGDGVSLCREIRNLHPKARRIAHTGADDGSIPPGLFHRILNKPSTGAEVRDALNMQIAAE